MLAIAQIDLGLSEDEFWDLTPAKFRALQLRRRDVMQREDYRFGTITYLIKSIFGVKNAHPLDDFGGATKRESRAYRAARETLRHLKRKKRIK